MSSRRSLIAIGDLTRDEITRMLDLAERFSEVMRRDIKKVPTLRGRTVINMFFEASTRTATSFELAGKRMSADVVNVKGSGSSVEKGETLKDTVLTLNAYQPDILVIRHRAAGACAAAARYTTAAVINAGDGKHEHPTQALLDLYTLRRATARLEGLHVAFVGDVLHSRWPAPAPSPWPPWARRSPSCRRPPCFRATRRRASAWRSPPTSATIADADVVYALRMQHERMGKGGFVPSLREYATQYGIGHHRLRPGQLVMHAGPMNRGVEITDDLADDPTALITTQVESGMVVRMAVMYDLLTESSAQRSPRGRRRSGGRVSARLVQRPGPAASLVIRGARILDPIAGIDRVGDLVVRDGVIGGDPAGLEEVDGTACWWCPASWTRTCTCARPGAKTPRTWPAARCRAPPAASWPSRPCPTPSAGGRRPGPGAPAELAERDAVIRGLHRRHHQGPGGLPAHRGRGARRAGRGCPLRRRPPGVRRRRVPAGAAVPAPGRPAVHPPRGGHAPLGDGCMHEGAVSARLGVGGIPAVSEAVAVGRDVLLAHYEGARIHICHVSAKETIEEVRRGKAMGVRITAEVSPHHLLLIDEDCENLDAATRKMNPPLRGRADREALVEALIDGTLDCVATDHARTGRARRSCRSRRPRSG